MRQILSKPFRICFTFRAQIFWGLVLGLAGSIPFLYFFTIHSGEIKSEIKKVISKSNILSTSTQKRNKEIIGFFPYWNLSKVNEVDLSNLTTIYYFAIDLSSDGSFNTEDPGISRLQSPNAHLLKDKVVRNGTKWGVTIVNLDADSIARNINNEARQQTIINNTIKLMKDNDFTALNIDLEYVGDSDQNLKNSFTSFTKKLTSRVKTEIPSSTVSIDFFSDSFKKPRIFDLRAIGQIVDQVIIMGYDFHRLSSIKAGPVAPLFGKELFEFDIASTVVGYGQLIPPEKLVLGVPFYGYEWPTEKDEKESFVIYSPRGPEISSYARSTQTAKENHASINFDDESKSVWFSYFDKINQTWRQVWFENERSLGLKFDLVNQANLAGIAIFALGYDGTSAKPLWDEVKLKFR